MTHDVMHMRDDYAYLTRQATAYAECVALVREAVTWRRATRAALAAGATRLPDEPRWGSWYERAGAAVDTLDAT